MKNLNYLLNGFGYDNLHDFITTIFKIFYVPKSAFFCIATASTVLGTLRSFMKASIGLDFIVFVAFVFLIVAEFQTGVKVSIQKKHRVQSRKIGRMILKIGVYVLMLFILNSFKSGFEVPDIMGFEMNPFVWIYFIVFTLIVMQLFISWLENLSSLGYSEANGVLGAILRKYNKWFEFDGTKNGDRNYEQQG